MSVCLSPFAEINMQAARPTTKHDAKSYYQRHHIVELLEQIAADLAVYQPTDPRRYIHGMLSRMLGIPENEKAPSLEKACTLRIYVECSTRSGTIVDQFFRTAPHIESSASMLRSWQQEGAACLVQAINRAVGMTHEHSFDNAIDSKQLPVEERVLSSNNDAANELEASKEASSIIANSSRVHELMQQVTMLSEQVEILQKDRAQAMMAQMSAMQGNLLKRKPSKKKMLKRDPTLPAIRRSSWASQTLQTCESEVCKMRIIAVSDMSEFDNMSNLDGLIRANLLPHAITVMCGNFLAPSILSSLDMGKSMIDVMNRVGGVGIQYACFGNREAEIPVGDLSQRLHEFHGVLINTNMPGLDIDPPLPEYHILQIEAEGQTRKIGLVGLVTIESSLYQGHEMRAFGGAVQSAESMLSALERVRKILIEQEGCDVVIPISHQPFEGDREMISKIYSSAGSKTAIPLLVGGHEHKPMMENESGCIIVKPGNLGKYVAVIDVTWESAETPGNSPTVVANFLASNDYPRSAQMDKVISGHRRLLDEVERAFLFPVPPDCTPLSSVGVQRQQTTIGTLLCSYVRDALSCDGVMIDAGAFLDDQTYPESINTFLYGNLRKQVPNESLVCVVKLPGAVLRAAVAYSRSKSQNVPPKNALGYLQIDDGMLWNHEEKELTHLCRKPIELEHPYRIGVLFHSLNGMNRNQPLIDWANQNGCNIPHSSVAVPFKEVIIKKSCATIWQQLLSHDFSTYDKDNSGFVDRSEIKEALHKLVGENSTLPDFMVTNVMSLVDADNDGTIDAKEFNNFLGFFGQMESFINAKSKCSLRIIAVNDVYELINFPFLDGVIRSHMRPNTITMLPGDFLAPSLLSSLDKGQGMIDMMNRVGGVGIQYVCFGNHETDVPIEEMRKRISEFKGSWINTNMPDFEPKLPDYKIIEIESGGQRRKVGLIGLLTVDMNLYRRGAFGGSIDTALPVYETAEKYRRLLIDELGCDLVIPMTHQVMAEDRQMARLKMGFPLIVGAHDHDPFLEEIDGCWIVKTGADAVNAAIIDITWPNVDTPGEKPEVEIKLVKCSDYAENKELTGRMREHLKIVEQMEQAYLTDVPPGIHLKSTGIRRAESTVGRFLCSLVRDGFRCIGECDGVLMDAGSIRRNYVYPEGCTQFTYGDLKKEIPFDTEIAVVGLQGKVIVEAVRASRARAFNNPPEDWGGYLQLDDGFEWDESTNTVTKINNAPVDPDREYHVGVILLSLNGMNRNQPLIDWANSNGDKVPPEEAARKAKDIIVERCSKEIISRLGDFKDIDTDGDGQLSLPEIQTAMSKVLRRKVTEIEVANFMQVIDADQSGFLSREEFEHGIRAMSHHP